MIIRWILDSCRFLVQLEVWSRNFSRACIHTVARGYGVKQCWTSLKNDQTFLLFLRWILIRSLVTLPSRTLFTCTHCYCIPMMKLTWAHAEPARPIFVRGEATSHGAILGQLYRRRRRRHRTDVAGNFAFSISAPLSATSPATLNCSLGNFIGNFVGNIW